jgi:hypothetical protein
MNEKQVKGEETSPKIGACFLEKNESHQNREESHQKLIYRTKTKHNRTKTKHNRTNYNNSNQIERGFINQDFIR